MTICKFKHLDKKYRDILKKSSCFLTISVGQEYHEGAKFAATVNLIDESFLSCKIMLYDTLQRYTMALNSPYSEDYFYKSALHEGDLWLDRNEPYFNKLTNLNGIIRWDFWLKSPKFLEQKEKIEKALIENIEYRNAFQRTIEQYLSRYFARVDIPEESNKRRCFQICLRYLIEECAALCLWSDAGCDFEVYPRARNLAMVETYKSFIANIYPNKSVALELKFKGKNQLRPQVFESLFPAGE